MRTKNGSLMWAVAGVVGLAVGLFGTIATPVHAERIPHSITVVVNGHAYKVLPGGHFKVDIRYYYSRAHRGGQLRHDAPKGAELDVRSMTRPANWYPNQCAEAGLSVDAQDYVKAFSYAYVVNATDYFITASSKAYWEVYDIGSNAHKDDWINGPGGAGYQYSTSGYVNVGIGGDGSFTEYFTSQAAQGPCNGTTEVTFLVNW